nr:MAG TPA: baseplate protein [Caudoviricetes sp.]
MAGTSGANSQGEWMGSNTSYGERAVTLSSTGGHNHTLYIGSTGSGQAFNIMNPYYAVNIWQRVG